MTWRSPDTYHSAGHGRGTATLKFYEGRDILDPDLGLDKDLRSLEARVPDSLAHLPLVAVCRGCVHVPVAVSERRLDCDPGLLRRRLEDPKTEGRQVDTVIQGHEFHASTVGPETEVEAGTAVTPSC